MVVPSVTGSSDETGRVWQLLPRGQALIDLGCARVHDLSLSEKDKERFGIEKEWCTPEVSAALGAGLGLDNPNGTPSPAGAAAASPH